NIAVLCRLVALSSIFVYIHFFFSSRRRHTRSKRDWSSDVCSSDLGDGHALRQVVQPDDQRRQHSAVAGGGRVPGEGGPDGHAHRSEERRVGKEGRSRCSTYQEKKKKDKRIVVEKVSQTADRRETHH